MNRPMPENPESILTTLRRAELGALDRLFQPGMKVLELGGQTGFQAAILAARGCEVTSLDIALPAGHQAPLRYPVEVYDGKHVPADDGTYDIVFTSHMLYWEMNNPDFLAEMRRVTGPGGLGIHIMPTVAWRIWTCATHYPHVMLRVGQVLWRKCFGAATDGARPATPWVRTGKRPGAWTRLKNLLFPGPLGPASGFVVEMRQWRREAVNALFKANGFETVEVIPLNLLYTGHLLLGHELSLAARRNLARLLGSASVAYVVHKEADDRPDDLPGANPEGDAA